MAWNAHISKPFWDVFGARDGVRDWKTGFGFYWPDIAFSQRLMSGACGLVCHVETAPGWTAVFPAGSFHTNLYVLGHGQCDKGKLGQ